MNIKVTRQPDGAPIVSVNTSSGRVIRVCGGISGDAKDVVALVDAMKNWVTWERQGSWTT